MGVQLGTSGGLGHQPECVTPHAGAGPQTTCEFRLLGIQGIGNESRLRLNLRSSLIRVICFRPTPMAGPALLHFRDVKESQAPDGHVDAHPSPPCVLPPSESHSTSPTYLCGRADSELRRSTHPFRRGQMRSPSSRTTAKFQLFLAIAWSRWLRLRRRSSHTRH